MRVSVVALVLSGSIYAAFGADLSKEYTECVGSATTTTEWGECSEHEIDRQEQSLTEAWEEAYAAMEKMSAVAAETLSDEQRAWVKFKDAACLYYASGALGRDGAGLQFGACKAAIIAQRIGALKALMQEMKR
jgi:uncharacterized protein YecT (DUF1311 family)